MCVRVCARVCVCVFVCVCVRVRVCVRVIQRVCVVQKFLQKINMLSPTHTIRGYSPHLFPIFLIVSLFFFLRVSPLSFFQNLLLFSLN